MLFLVDTLFSESPYSRLTNEFCTTRSSPIAFTARSRKLWIQFKSDQNNTAGGFSIPFVAYNGNWDVFLSCADVMSFLKLCNLSSIMHINMHIYICVHICMHIHICIFIYAYIYVCTHIYVYIHIISRRSTTPQHIKYNSKPLDVVQSLYFAASCLRQERKFCRIAFIVEIVLHPMALSYIYIYIYIS